MIQSIIWSNKCSYVTLIVRQKIQTCYLLEHSSQLRYYIIKKIKIIFWLSKGRRRRRRRSKLAPLMISSIKLVQNVARTGRVTRFEQIFATFGNILKYLGNFLDGLFSIWHFYASGQIVLVINGHRWNNNMAIWSHCSDNWV